MRRSSIVISRQEYVLWLTIRAVEGEYMLEIELEEEHGDQRWNAEFSATCKCCQ